MENRKESDSFDTECTITTLPNIAPNMVMGQLTQSARESSSAILAGNETSARIQTSTTMAADLRWQQMQEQFLQNQQTMQTMMLQMNEMQKQISASTPCGNDSAGKKKRKIDESSTSGKEKGKQLAEKVTPIHDISDISDEETDRDGFKDLLNGRESDAEDPEDSDSGGNSRYGRSAPRIRRVFWGRRKMWGGRTCKAGRGGQQWCPVQIKPGQNKRGRGQISETKKC